MSMFGRTVYKVNNYASIEEVEKTQQEIKQIKKELKALEWRTNARGKGKVKK